MKTNSFSGSQRLNAPPLVGRTNGRGVQLIKLPLYEQCLISRSARLLVVSAQSKRGPQQATRPASKPEFVELPSPGLVQQTLKRAFVLGGVGLHTAEYAFIRVIPARAGEGRYFVRVTEGTISRSKLVEEFKSREREIMEDAFGGQRDPEGQRLDERARLKIKEKQLEDYLAFLEAKEGGYAGTPEDFFVERNRGAMKAFHEGVRRAMDEIRSAPDYVPRSESEPYIPASAQYAEGTAVQTVLRRGDAEVRGVEHLLAALEACGVDNARIEIEGGREVPVVEGAAIGWTSLIVANGVVACAGDAPPAKLVPRLTQPVAVTGDNGAFISAFPDAGFKITAGVHAPDVPAIGSQWFTWVVYGDRHFYYELAPAKTFYRSEQEVEQLYASGVLQAGPKNVALVAMGDSWVDPLMVTFPVDEPARHRVLDMCGDLALLNVGGQGGLPVGHIVSYGADHRLQVEFVRRLAEAPHEMVPWGSVPATAPARVQVEED